MISSNPEVLRTVKGHAFEYVFDDLMNLNGVESFEIGGDSDIDRIVNGHTLQLKTPNKAGTKGNVVEYKTHKTHGPKSQGESLDYYSKADDFAEYLVGLISYHPLKILFLDHNSLPRLPENSDYIKSPFKYSFENSPLVNNFDCIECGSITIPDSLDGFGEEELLPETCKITGLNSDAIIHTIVDNANFRIWDMNMRGFAREDAFKSFLNTNKIKVFNSKVVPKDRSEKSDLALKSKNNEYFRFQIKGITLRSSVFEKGKSIVDVESQLSRGRINDHPTQSRLYYESDFDYLIVCLDPVYSNLYSKTEKDVDDFHWNFYCIPSNELKHHPKYPNRINAHQHFSYKDLCKYKIDPHWLNQWATEFEPET